jgi:hypothetical protein
MRGSRRFGSSRVPSLAQLAVMDVALKSRGRPVPRLTPARAPTTPHLRPGVPSRMEACMPQLSFVSVRISGSTATALWMQILLAGSSGRSRTACLRGSGTVPLALCPLESDYGVECRR